MMTGDTYIKIDPATMISVANIIESETGKIESRYSNINNICKNLRNNWEGESSDLFINSMTEISDPLGGGDSAAARIIVSILKEYVLDLREIARKFEDTEKLNVELSGALDDDIFHV